MARIIVYMVGDSKSLERAYKRAAGAAHKFHDETEKASRTSHRSMGRTTQTTSRFHQITEKAVGKTKHRLFGGLGSIAASSLGAVGVGGGLLEAAGAGIKFNSQMQQSQVAFKNLLGSGPKAQKMLSDLYKLAAHTPFEFPELTKATQKMLGFGIKAKDVLPTMQAVGDAVAGVGGGQEQVEGVTRAIGQMQAKGKISLEELNQLAEQGIPGVKILAEGLGETLPEFMAKHTGPGAAAITAKEGIPLLTQGLEKHYGGMAEAQGKTFAGRISTLKDTLNQGLGKATKPIFDALSTKILPAAQRLADEFNKNLAPAIGNTLGKWADWISKADNQKKILDTVKGVIHAVTRAVRMLRTAFHWLSVAVGGNKNAIKFLIGMYAGFKILQIAGRINRFAASFRGLRRAEAGARGATGALRGSLVGKAGLAAGVFAAGYELSRLIRRIPGWDKRMRDFGGTIYDVFSKIGLVHDPMKQFRGKIVPGQQLAGQIRQQAAQLEQRGMSPQQAAAQLARSHPGMALHDIQVLAGVFGRRPSTVRMTLGGRTLQPGVTINMHNVHLPGVHNPRQFEDHMRKRAKKRPHTRR